MNSGAQNEITERLTRKRANIFIITMLALTAIAVFMNVRGISKAGVLNYFVLFCIVGYTFFKAFSDGFLFNPYMFFALTPISLMIYDVGVSEHYLVELEQSTYNLVFWNFLCLLAGFSLAKKYRLTIGKKEFVSKWAETNTLTSKELSKHAWILIGLGMLPSIYGCLRGMEYLLTLKLYQVKGVVSSMPLSSVFQLFLYPAVFCAIFSKNKKTILFVLVLAVFSVAVNFSKTTVVMLSVTVLIAYYNSVAKAPRKKKTAFVLLFCAALVFFYFSFEIYNNMRHDYDTNKYFSSLGYIGNISEDWFLVVMYLISPWANLQYIVQTTQAHTWGLWAIKPFLGYLQLDTALERAYSLVPLHTAFNTFTFISPFYRDFGFWGSGLESFILGIYIMKVYKLFKDNKKSPLVNSIYAMVAYATVMLFFNNHFLQLSYPITIYIIMILYRKFFVGKKS